MKPNALISISPRQVARAVADFVKKEYGGNVAGDLFGGLTTAVVALPLALAFALASGVEARYGLYTAIVTGFVAAIFGGSKVQVTGPTGGMAAILITVTAAHGHKQVMIVALLAGLFQIIFGILRLGRFVKMLPFPLVAGFTMGIGLVILGGQVDNALGLQLQHHHTEFLERFFETVGYAWRTGFSAVAAAVTLGVVLLSIGMGRAFPRLPGTLVAVVASALAVWAFDLQIPRIMDIPRTLPSPEFPAFSWLMVRELVRPAAIVAALGAIESLLAAVVADNVLGDGSKHNSNRELVGQGLANIAASFFGGIPCTGAIARTSVNIRSGGRTRLAAVIHSIILITVMFFLAPLATFIPKAALAGVLILTSIRMVEWREVRWLMTAPRSDIVIMGVTVLVTVFTDLVLAVEFGLAAAGILFIRKMSETTPTLVKLESADQSLTADHKHIRIFRIPGPLFWGGSHAILEALEECEEARVVILKMQLVSHIDASGVAVLREAKERLRRRGITLLLANVPHRILAVMGKMGVTDEIGSENIHSTLESAKTAAFKKVQGITAPIRQHQPAPA